MGDIVALVEKAAEHVTAADAAKMAKKLKKGVFDLEDLQVGQLLQMKKMGGMGALMGLMPGMGQMKKAMSEANVNEKVFDRQVAIINSMTKKEWGRRPNSSTPRAASASPPAPASTSRTSTS